MSGSSLHKPSSSIIEKSHVNRETYEKMYEESINDPSLFWQKHGKRIRLFLRWSCSPNSFE